MKYVSKTFGVRIKFSRTMCIRHKKIVSSLIRTINMDYHPKGFAGNKGFKDDFLTNIFGFSWYFNSKLSREEALQDLSAIVSSKLLKKIDIKPIETTQSKNKTFYKRVRRIA